MRRALMLLALFTLMLSITACSRSSGLPVTPGEYTLKKDSVSFDGERYSFFWADAEGNLQRVNSSDVKLRLDEKNALEITPEGDAILHLTQDEPVTVEARDENGDFGTFWYPFLLGSMLSPGGPVIVNNPAPREFRDPVYRYPPTDRFGRGDTMSGNATNTRPAPPDYGRLAPVGGTVSGQGGGTGGANAATNKADAPAAVTGQSGGTGTGSAALNKSGSFRGGSQGYGAKVDSGQIKPISGGSGSRVGAGSGALGGSSGRPSISTGNGSSGTIKPASPPKRSVPRISVGRRR